MCKVSVLVPIYNVENYLEKCLESLIQQTLNDIEIICINDGSTDGSLRILEKYEKKDNRIKIIDKKNTGYGHSMNQGLKYATGEYIGVVESDDFADENMFKELYFFAKRKNSPIVYSDYIVFNENNQKVIEYFSGIPYERKITPIQYEELFCGTPIWVAIYNREFLLMNNIFFTETPGASYQDISFGFKALACADTVLLVKKAFLHYRMDNMNSSMNNDKKVYAIFDEFDEIEKFLSMRKDLSLKLKNILSYVKYKHCKVNFYRIGDRYKLDFLERMYKEFYKENQLGLLKKEYWDLTSWSDIHVLLQSKETFCFTALKKIQKQRLCSLGFLNKIKNFAHIYLYGAGKVARFVVKYLTVHGIKIDGIIVSRIENNEKTFRGLKVMAFDEAEIGNCDIVLIAVKDADQMEIARNLYGKGYINAIMMDGELREALVSTEKRWEVV